jgi:tetratricopeptide (TPR) repeat protein
MTDQPQKSESSNSVTNVSGGVNASAEQINVGADVVGRDKVVSAQTYIEHYHAGGEAARSKPKVYHNLPQPDYTRFIGREQELAWLRERLSPKDRAWQIAITGIGGVGKSALALALAREYLERYEALAPEERFAAIIWISAKEEVLTTQGRDQAAPPGLILRSLDDIYAAIAQTLEREDITLASSPKEQDRLIQKALTERRTLLVMDNLESVTDERVRPFLRYLPGQTKAIVTSREWLEVADVLSLTGLSNEEAGQLLVAEAAARRIVLPEDQCQQLIEITSGLPLPLRLGVARLASGESMRNVLRWLGDATGDLPEYCVNGQADLAFERDRNCLSLLLACSLFDRSTGASREALGFVSDLSVAERDKALANLQRLFLVNQMKFDRFWLLPIVQRYASTLFSQSDWKTMTDRWLEWLMNYAKQYGAHLELHIEYLEMMHGEYPNIRTAIQWCQEHSRWEVLMRLAEGSWWYPYHIGLFNECEDILMLALQAARLMEDIRAECKVERQIARLAVVKEDSDEALRHAERAMALAEQLGDDQELATALLTRLDMLSDLDELAEVEKNALRALEMGKQLQDLNVLNLASYRLATVEARKGNFQRATAWLDEAEHYATQLNSIRRLTAIAARRGIYSVMQGDLFAAESFFVKALEIDTARGERRYVAHNKLRLAEIYAQTGRPQIAEQFAEEAFDIYERCGLTVKMARAEKLLREIQAAQRSEGAP